MMLGKATVMLSSGKHLLKGGFAYALDDWLRREGMAAHHLYRERISCSESPVAFAICSTLKPISFRLSAVSARACAIP